MRICMVGAILLSVSGLGAGQSLPAMLPQPQTFGMVGLTAGQTARLSVLNPGPPAPLAAGAICSAQVTFLDAKGSVLKTAPLLIAPGQSVSYDLDRDTDVTGTDQRVQIRATVQTPTPTPFFLNPVQAIGCPLVATLEVFNNDTGRTQFVLTDLHVPIGILPLPVAPAPMPTP